MKRYEYIDIAKGICILLVVVKHLPTITMTDGYEIWGGGMLVRFLCLSFSLLVAYLISQKILLA